MLAGLPQAPSELNPFQNPRGALERRNQRAAQDGEARLHLQGSARRRPASRPLGVERGDLYTRIREPFFFDYVKQQLIDKFGVNTVRKGGLKVYTTIDPKLQAAGRKAIDSTLPYPADPSAAVVAIDPRNGYIKAMASSSSYKHKQFNLAAQGHRQPGSAFKTFVLTTAIRRGINPNTTTYVSKPLDLKTKDYGPWKVQTYDQTYGGSMNLVRATLRSDNTVYAQLDLDLGPKSVAETAKDMGITTKLDGYPAEGLGGLTRGVSPLEMANAYATLASGGIRNKPIAIRARRVPGRRRRGPRQAEARARALRRRRLRGDEDPEAERHQRHRHAGQHRLSLGGQDRHHRQLQRRLVRRLHALPSDVGLGRLPERAARDAKRARHLGRRRHLPGRDLEQVHADREGARTATTSRARPATVQWTPFFGKYSTQSGYSTRHYDYSGPSQGDSDGGGYRRLRPRIYDGDPTHGNQPRRWRRWWRRNGGGGNGGDGGGTGGAEAAPVGGGPDGGDGPGPASRGATGRPAARRRPWRGARAPGAARARLRARSPYRSRRRTRRSCWPPPSARPTGCSVPGGLLGPSGADGALTGPLFYAGLWVALLAYVVVLACSQRDRRAARDRRRSSASTLLFVLAPPLLSQDVFSYIAYARLDVRARPQPLHAQPGRRPARPRLRLRRLEGRDQRLRAALHAADAAAREAERAGGLLDAEGRGGARPSLGDRRARLAVRPPARPRPGLRRARGRTQPARARARRRRSAQRRARGAALRWRAWQRCRRSTGAGGGRPRARQPALKASAGLVLAVPVRRRAATLAR